VSDGLGYAGADRLDHAHRLVTASRASTGQGGVDSSYISGEVIGATGGKPLH
jgi:hypothetical protein